MPHGAKQIAVDAARAPVLRGVRPDGRLRKHEAKAALLRMAEEGIGPSEGVRSLGFTVQTYEAWRREDRTWAEQMSQTLRLAKIAIGQGKRVRHAVPKDMGFPEFSEKYLRARVFPHTQNVVDLLEGREPSWLHPAMTYRRGEDDLVIVNMPPEHCATLDTPILTRDRGWVTVGEVTTDDWLYDPNGLASPVTETWRPEAPVPTFDVEFDSGDVITTDAGHKWVVYPVFAGTRARSEPRLMTTEQVMNSPDRWRVRVASPLDAADVDLPMDPYLLGYWLGDGDRNGARFAVGDEDLAAFEVQLDLLGLSRRVRRDSRGRSWEVYVHGLRAPLRELGLLGVADRSLPEVVWRMSFKQRLSLLQGLMDADGTITEKDSRARFVQHKERMARDVHRLVASLGLKPHLKRYGDAWEVGFRTGSEPAFRLERKAGRQKPWTGTSRAAHRVIREVRPTGRTEMVQCISLLSSNNEYLIGNGMIPTRNAKTTSFSINYVTYRLCQQPNLRVLLVSKTTQMAEKFLYAIKDRLTGPNFASLIEDWAPRGGFSGNSGRWTQDTIYLNPEVRDSGEKDPSVQALGIGSHIYGSRADLIILDDVVDSSNAKDYAKQIEWIQSHVLSRLSNGGTLLLVGTRLEAQDLYAEIQRDDLYPEETSPWTYLAMPAVLEFDDDRRNWVTLWPRTDSPEISDRKPEPGPDGLYPKWDGPRLFRKRARMMPNLWARVYQQMQVTSDTVFDPADIRGCTNGARNVGLIPLGKAGNREGGMTGLVPLAGLDPATSGFTAAVVIGLDVRTKRRYVLDAFNRSGCKPDEIRQMIYDLTEKYAIVEWVVETNGFQGFLAMDREVNQFLANRGALVRPHHTGVNKADPDFGVAAMSGLFRNWREGQNLIELPSTHASEALKALTEQLAVWAPDPRLTKKRKSDIVMALWMAELACQRRVNIVSNHVRSHQRNPFLTRADRARQMSVDITDIDTYDRLVAAR